MEEFYLNQFKKKAIAVVHGYGQMLLLLLLLLQVIPCLAQLNISGKVVDGQTGLPVAGASVYFNNTSLGTSSNSAGEFSFKNIDLVNTELIVSSVGYEILVLKLNGAKANGKYFLCQLSIKEQQLKDVLILADARKRALLNIFKENFLGITREADKSKIVNLGDIYFTAGENKSTFKAYADTPLVIINNLLGYKVYFQLIEFSFDDANGATYFYGYTRYEELGDKKRWTRNRKNAYLGSTLHFYRALIHDRLDDEGYSIYTIKNMQKDSSLPNMSVAVTTLSSQIISLDSADTNYFRVTVPGKLMVQNRRDPASKYYLAKKVLLQGNMKVGFRAYVSLKAPFFLVDHNGILENPLSVENGGYWMYERAANLLPFNYQPEE